MTILGNFVSFRKYSPLLELHEWMAPLVRDIFLVLEPYRNLQAHKVLYEFVHTLCQQQIVPHYFPHIALCRRSLANLCKLRSFLHCLTSRVLHHICARAVGNNENGFHSSPLADKWALKNSRIIRVKDKSFSATLLFVKYNRAYRSFSKTNGSASKKAMQQQRLGFWPECRNITNTV